MEVLSADARAVAGGGFEDGEGGDIRDLRHAL
jgi:hypothetical protein